MEATSSFVRVPQGWNIFDGPPQHSNLDHVNLKQVCCPAPPAHQNTQDTVSAGFSTSTSVSLITSQTTGLIELFAWWGCVGIIRWSVSACACYTLSQDDTMSILLALPAVSERWAFKGVSGAPQRRRYSEQRNQPRYRFHRAAEPHEIAAGARVA